MKIINTKPGICIAFFIGILISMTSVAGTIGVNLNGMLQNSANADLTTSETVWVRGFVDYFAFKEGVKNINTDPGILRFKQLKSEGFKVILSLKYDFTNRNFPTTQAEADALLNYHTAILNQLYEHVDIIVAGNEPFIESKPAQRTSALLVEFYKKTAQRVRNYQVLNNKPQKPIYIGSFNRLWNTVEQTQAVEDYLTFARNISWIAGADLHIHHDVLAQIDTVFNYVQPRLRADQKIIVTEFSFMKKWKNALNQTIPAALTVAPYNRPASLAVWQYLERVLNPNSINRVTKAEWDTFLNNSPWFAPNYLQNAFNKMNSYNKFHIATYGMYQSYPSGAAYANNPFTSNSDPWIINPLFANRTVNQISPNVYHPNTKFLAAFKNLPH